MISGTLQQASAAPLINPMRDSPGDGLAVGAAVGDAVGAAVGDAVGAVRRECKAGRGETKGWVSGVRELKTGREERESMKREAQKPRKDTKRGGGDIRRRDTDRGVRDGTLQEGVGDKEGKYREGRKREGV